MKKNNHTTPNISSISSISSILLEAQNLVHGDRAKDYGDPTENWGQTAKLWSIIIGKEVSIDQAVMCMIAAKISRQLHTSKRDNWVDMAGYAEVGSLCNNTNVPNTSDTTYPPCKKCGSPVHQQIGLSLSCLSCNHEVVAESTVNPEAELRYLWGLR